MCDVEIVIPLLDTRSRPVCTAAVRPGLMVTNPDDADDCRDEPANGGEEREGYDSLPVAALIRATEADVVPVEDTATRASEKVDNQTKCDEPADRDDDVDGPVDEGAREWEQPDGGEEDGNTGHDLSVDEPGLVPTIRPAD